MAPRQKARIQPDRLVPASEVHEDMRHPRARSRKPRVFNVHAFLEQGRVAGRIVRVRRGGTVFSQGDPCESVFYIQKGGVALRVVSHGGKEAIVAMLGPGDFIGEGVLAGQAVRMATAFATTACTLLVVEKQEMSRLLHEQPALSDRFLAYVLARNIRVEADLVDRLFNPSEKRLARTLLLLARYGRQETARRVLPRISQQTLADMVGTTRSRVNFFMNKFRRLGFVEYNGALTVNDSLLSVVLHE